MAIETPFVEDFLGGYFALPGELIEGSPAYLQVLRKLFDGHNGTGHLGLSSHSVTVSQAKTIPISNRRYDLSAGKPKDSPSQPIRRNSATETRSRRNYTRSRQYDFEGLSL